MVTQRTARMLEEFGPLIRPYFLASLAGSILTWLPLDRPGPLEALNGLFRWPLLTVVVGLAVAALIPRPSLKQWLRSASAAIVGTAAAGLMFFLVVKGGGQLFGWWFGSLDAAGPFVAVLGLCSALAAATGFSIGVVWIHSQQGPLSPAPKRQVI